MSATAYPARVLKKKTPRFEEIPMTYGFTAVKDGVIVVFTHDLWPIIHSSGVIPAVKLTTWPEVSPFRTWRLGRDVHSLRVLWRNSFKKTPPIHPWIAWLAGFIGHEEDFTPPKELILSSGVKQLIWKICTIWKNMQKSKRFSSSPIREVKLKALKSPAMDL